MLSLPLNIATPCAKKIQGTSCAQTQRWKAFLLFPEPTVSLHPLPKIADRLWFAKDWIQQELFTRDGPLPFDSNPPLALTCKKHTSGTPWHSLIEPIYRIFCHTDPFHTAFHPKKCQYSSQLQLFSQSSNFKAAHISYQMMDCRFHDNCSHYPTCLD